MPSYDRTENGIVGLLKDIWPELEAMTSLEIQNFLNEQSGCQVEDGTPNGEANDIWRQALARHPDRSHVWPYSQEYLHKVQVRSREMKAEEEERQRKLQADDSR